MKQINADQALAIAAIIVLIPMGLLSSGQPSTQALVWVLSAAAILFRSTICILLTLSAIFVGYYLLSNTSAAKLNLFDVVLAVLTVAYVSIALRYMQVSGKSIATTFWTKLSDQQQQPEATPVKSNHYFRPWAGFAYSITVAVVVALILMASMPVWRFEDKPYGLVAPVLRVIAMFWILALGGIGVHVVFSFFRDRRMTREQGHLMTLRTIDDELGREQSAIEKRIARD